MIEADRLLDDEDLVEVVFQAQGQRHAHSSTLGRAQTPAETVLRLLLLKHVRNWSFDTLEREVTLNLTPFTKNSSVRRADNFSTTATFDELVERYSFYLETRRTSSSKDRCKRALRYLFAYLSTCFHASNRHPSRLVGPWPHMPS
jgi:hypothetical protein